MERICIVCGKPISDDNDLRDQFGCHTDIHAHCYPEVCAALDEIAILRTEKHADTEAIGALRVALHNCLHTIDGLIEESGRSIECGEEDTFRMGEWFDLHDIHLIEAARAALKGSDQ